VPINPPKQGFIVRRMNMHGMQYLILKALQRAKATGLRMRDRSLVLQVMRCVYEPPAMNDWDEEVTKKSFRMAKQITELLEDDEHRAGNFERDFRGEPLVIAVPTALAAVLALRHGGDITEVRTLAGRLVAALQQTNYNVSAPCLSRIDINVANHTCAVDQTRRIRQEDISHRGGH
jgi:hypothetical protein